jgi:hypothetical protein
MPPGDCVAVHPVAAPGLEEHSGRDSGARLPSRAGARQPREHLLLRESGRRSWRAASGPVPDADGRGTQAGAGGRMTMHAVRGLTGDYARLNGSWREQLHELAGGCEQLRTRRCEVSNYARDAGEGAWLRTTTCLWTAGLGEQPHS